MSSNRVALSRQCAAERPQTWLLGLGDAHASEHTARPRALNPHRVRLRHDTQRSRSRQWIGLVGTVSEYDKLPRRYGCLQQSGWHLLLVPRSHTPAGLLLPLGYGLQLHDLPSRLRCPLRELLCRWRIHMSGFGSRLVGCGQLLTEDLLDFVLGILHRFWIGEPRRISRSGYLGDTNPPQHERFDASSTCDVGCANRWSIYLLLTGAADSIGAGCGTCSIGAHGTNGLPDVVHHDDIGSRPPRYR